MERILYAYPKLEKTFAKHSFICPNGHETCDLNPSGYQWFDLTKDDPNYILNESLKARKN